MTNHLIHPTAIIDSTAQLGNGVEVGPFSIIGADVVIGDNTKILSHAVIKERTILGETCEIHPGAVLGGDPQDYAYKGEPTRLRIGNNTIIRECVTVSRATGEGQETVIGDNCFLMAYSHIGHNGWLGNHVILSNTVQLAGHVHLHDYVIIGGGTVVHQNVRIGRMAFLGGGSACRQEVPPFAMSDGRPTVITGINSVGMKRRGLTMPERQRIKKAFWYLFFSDFNQTQGIEAVKENLACDGYITELLEFIAASKRGIVNSNKKSPTSASRNMPGDEVDSAHEQFTH